MKIYKMIPNRHVRCVWCWKSLRLFENTIYSESEEHTYQELTINREISENCVNEYLQIKPVENENIYTRFESVYVNKSTNSKRNEKGKRKMKNLQTLMK